MFRVLYILWLLLPLTFYGLSVWALCKRWFGCSGKEYYRDYLAQGIYCTVALVIAIAIDQTAFFEDLVDKLTFGTLDIAVARWLLYPAILVAMAYGQKGIGMVKKDKSTVSMGARV